MLIGLFVPDLVSGASFLQPPIDFLYASTLLKRAKHRIQFLDNRVHHVSVTETARYFREADAIVITTAPYDVAQNYFVDYRIVLSQQFLNALKRLLPDVPIILVGPHGTARPDIILRETRADIILRGEYEWTLAEVMSRIVSACHPTSSAFAWPHIDGCIVRNVGESSLSHPCALCRRAEALDDVFADYTILDVRDYYADSYQGNIPMRSRGWAVILSQRGCPFPCNYCWKMLGHRVRRRSPEGVVREMASLKKSIGIKGIHFLDATFTQDRTWVVELCERILRSDLQLPWTAQTRCDALDKELLRLLVRAGCKRLWLGIEHFHEDIQRTLRKYKSVNCIYDAIDACRASGLEPSAFIMLGPPGETRETLDFNIGKVFETGLTYTKSIIVATPLFGTRYFSEMDKAGSDVYETWMDIARVRGLALNELAPHDLLRAITRLTEYRGSC